MSDPATSSTPWGQYPQTRLRRLRRYEWSRRLVAEQRLSVDDLILPLFVHEGEKRREPIASMPGVDRLSIDFVVETVETAISVGIPAVALFPATELAKKTADAAEATNAQNLVCRAVRAVKAAHGEAIGVICDVALDPYTSHGHDGLVINHVAVPNQPVVTVAGIGIESDVADHTD